ncbi:MAG: S49 family peptidase [Bacteroidetes bacterium]|nr:S49 family peptidase [Bacteroidota bacterium]
MSKVLDFLSSSVWAMRQHEFDVMMMVAFRQLDTLEEIAAEAESKPLPEAMTTKRGERLMNTRYVEIRDGVAIIDVYGRIAKRMGFFAEICSGGTSTETLLKDFQTTLDNPNVSSIVFNIDSPGGEAFGINELSQHIYNARGKKPMSAYVSGLGCSGAYWIASACDEVVCDKSAFLGSIGVVSMWIDDTEAYKKLGFNKKVVTSSNAPKKRLDLNTEEGLKEFQAELDAMEDVFISAVRRNRGKKTNRDVIADFNQGGILCGSDAVKAGMADRVGSLETVIKELARKGKNKASFGAENEGEIEMSWKDTFKEMSAKLGFRVEEKPETETEAEEKKTKVEKPADESSNASSSGSGDHQAQSTAKSAAEIELEKMKADREQEKREQLQKDAEKFVSAEITAGRLYPAEKDGFLSTYLQAAKDDEASPLESGSRVANLKATQEARPKHGLTEEILEPSTGFKVLIGEQSVDAKLAEEIEAQTDSYVATVNPKPKKLEVVK